MLSGESRQLCKEKCNLVPSEHKCAVASFESNVYNVRISDNGEHMAVGTQDQAIYIFDASDPSYEGEAYPQRHGSPFGLKFVKKISGSFGNWTMTDMQIIENEVVGHISLAPFIELVRISDLTRSLYMCEEEAALMSFVTVGSQIFAGSKPVGRNGFGRIYGWDVNQKTNLFSVEHGRSDCNAIAVLDNHLIASAGDDTFIKLWDTRLLGSKNKQQYVGYLSGHTQGITSLDAYGGTFLCSNGKDQKLKLFDIRSLSPKRPAKSKERQYDYRWDSYQCDPTVSQHPDDKSIRTFMDHSVYATMIKAKFSPDGKYVYSGSANGSVYIWDLQGELVSTVHGPVSDLSGSEDYYNSYYDRPIIRDMAWHPTHPVMFAGSFAHSGARYSQLLFIDCVIH